MNLTHRTVDGTELYTLESRGDVLGYVAVDSTINGRSCGGLRMLPDVDAEEMCGLARAMTLKYGFLGLPQGGAKAGIRGNPEATVQERRALLAEFGAGIDQLLREETYVPYPDMGTCAADILAMLSSRGIHPGRRAVKDHDSGHYTAISVAASAEAAVRRLSMNSMNCRAAIEGFGKVGRSLAVLLSDAGYKIAAVSTRLGAVYNPDGLDVDHLLRLSTTMGSALVEDYPDADRIPAGQLLELPVELLSPCARHHSLHIGNAPRVRCRIISPGANNPTTEEADKVLLRRGILCIPDFVANCGGVLGGTMEFAGMSYRRLSALIRTGMNDAVEALLEESNREGESPRAIAERLSRARFRDVKHGAENPGPAGRILQMGLSLHRRGLIPSPVVGRLSRYYFKRLPIFLKNR
jgi:glutamate dehydrogenase (NAD(P)+)